MYFSHAKRFGRKSHSHIGLPCRISMRAVDEVCYTDEGFYWILLAHMLSIKTLNIKDKLKSSDNLGKFRYYESLAIRTLLVDPNLGFLIFGSSLTVSILSSETVVIYVVLGPLGSYWQEYQLPLIC